MKIGSLWAGVVEVFTLALMRATGIEIEGCGSDGTRWGFDTS